MGRADIFYIDGSAVDDFERNVLEIGERFDVAASAHIVFGGGNFKDFATDVVVGIADFGNDIGERDAVSGQFVRIKVNLVFLHEAADGRDFRDARNGFESVTQMPILQRTQIGEALGAVRVHQGVFVNPAN